MLPVQNIINVAIHVTTQARSPFSNNVLSSFKQERKKGDEQAETTKSENSDKVYFVFPRCEGIPFCLQASKGPQNWFAQVSLFNFL